jgi:hypothetical protein
MQRLRSTDRDWPQADQRRVVAVEPLVGKQHGRVRINAVKAQDAVRGEEQRQGLTGALGLQMRIEREQRRQASAPCPPAAGGSPGGTAQSANARRLAGPSVQAAVSWSMDRRCIGIGGFGWMVQWHGARRGRCTHKHVCRARPGSVPVRVRMRLCQ